jgi:hypothetical protein
MNQEEHKAAAESLLEDAERGEAELLRMTPKEGPDEGLERSIVRDIARAQVHATLALVPDPALTFTQMVNQGEDDD